MDYSIAMVWIAVAFADFGKWHLVRCEVFSNSELSSIDEMIEQLMSCRQIPGLGMAIAKDDQFLAKGYGVADVKEETPMSGDTVMCIGSATKAFTSALIAVLITEDNENGGTLSWTTSLQEIFGEEFRLTSDPMISPQVTIEDILSHRSGVGSADAMLMAQLYPEQHRKALLSRLHFLPKKGEFRGQFSYNNLMYGLAGLAAEAIGKKPYFELMKDKLLEPLNISSAVLVDNMDYSQNRTSKPHQMVNGSVGLSDQKFFRLGSFSPAGALCLSSADLTKWLYFLNNYGTTLSQKRLINSLVFSKMISSKVALDFMTQLNLGLFKTFPEPSYTSWYALGWFGRFYRGDIDFFHGGSMFSFHSTIVMNPTSKTGIALTVNGLNPTPLSYDLYPLAYFLKDILLGQSPWLNVTTICSYPEPWVPSSPRAPPKQDVREKYVGSTEEYVGIFGHALYGEVLITEDGQSLNFQWGNIIKGTLYDHKKSKFRLRLHDNVFLVLGSEFGSANIAFSDYSSGQYNKIRMTLFSLMETYDFTRGVLFEVSSTSSSAVSVRTQNTHQCSLSHRSFLFTLILSLVLTW